MDKKNKELWQETLETFDSLHKPRAFPLFFRKKSRPDGPFDFIVAGLGNPGKEYVGSRHNAGFMALMAFAGDTPVKKIRFKSYTGEKTVGDRRVLLLLPQTFMNLSGQAVREAMTFYKLPPERALILLDDATLPVGTIRLRRQGSDGGQRGMRSIIEMTNSDAFPRVKIGVGEKPHPDYNLADWVLSHFTDKEMPALKGALDKAAQAAAMIVQDRMEEAMNRFSG